MSLCNKENEPPAPKSDKEILTAWQKSFKSIHNRDPSKEDFKSAPENVQQAGSRYQKSKSSSSYSPKKDISLKSDLKGFSLKGSKSKSSIGLKIAKKRKALEEAQEPFSSNIRVENVNENKNLEENPENNKNHERITAIFPESNFPEQIQLPPKQKSIKFSSNYHEILADLEPEKSNFTSSSNVIKNTSPYLNHEASETDTETIVQDCSPYASECSSLSNCAISPFDFPVNKGINIKSPRKVRANLELEAARRHLLKTDPSCSQKFDLDIRNQPLVADSGILTESPSKTTKENGGCNSTKTNIFEKTKLQKLQKIQKFKTDEASKASKALADKIDKANFGSAMISQNFQKLDMKKKIFVKGGNNAKKLQKQVYKEKLNKKFGGTFAKNSKNSSSSSKTGGGRVNPKWGNTTETKCFKCGLPGHWAADCSTNKKLDQNVLDNLKKDFNPEEIDQIHADIDNLLKTLDKEKYESFECETEITISENRKLIQKPTSLSSNEVKFSDEEISDGLRSFGFETFREGQKEAISAILKDRRNTLVVLATGQGKSLTFQIPAMLLYKKFKFLTLIISPLVSLMDDQVKNLPKSLPACRINSQMTEKQKDKVMLDLALGKYAMLYISPEAINSWCSNPDSPFLRDLPPIGLAVIDEIHCLSQWSHSFRPSYLRVCSILKRLHVPVLMGLTATATKETCHEVTHHLDAHKWVDMEREVDTAVDVQDCFLLRKVNVPKNIILSCCKIENSNQNSKDSHLLEVLTSPRYEQLDSIIIYCTRRDECERVTDYLQTVLPRRPGYNTAYSVEVYHAGLTPAKRRKVQKEFMSGQTNIIVATVAFGMGIDKHDVRSVIHYNLPKNFESYVQEIGRSGRDGKLSYCHLIFCEDDLQELSRFAYAKYIDRPTIKKFVTKCLVPYHCNCDITGTGCVGHEHSFALDLAVAELDVSKETLETLVNYLEHQQGEQLKNKNENSGKLIQAVRGVINADITIKCYNGAKQLALLAQKCPPVAVAVATKPKSERPDFTTQNELNFNSIVVADRLNTEIYSLRRKIRQITWDPTMIPGYEDMIKFQKDRSSKMNDAVKTGISIEYSNLSLWFRSCKLSSQEIDNKIDYLNERTNGQVARELKQLYLFYHTAEMNSFTEKEFFNSKNSFLSEKSTKFKKIIDNYFETDDFSLEFDSADQDDSTEGSASKSKKFSTQTGIFNQEAANLARSIYNQHGFEQGDLLTPRAIANILYGINTPCFPAMVWGRQFNFWRRGLHIDYMDILRSAQDEFVNFKLR